MKKILAWALTAALILSALVLPAGAEGAAVFSPASAPGTTDQPTVLETSIPGLTLTVGADEWSVGEAENIVSASGVSYPTYLTGKANPKVDEGVGTYYSFTVDAAVKTGALEVTYRLNANKGFFILDNGQAMKDYDGMKLDVSSDVSTTLIVEGGHTYTMYAKGSKLRFYGCSFQNVEPQEVFAQEIARFPFERIKGTNADAQHVDEDLALVDSYESQFGSCDVSWTSSDPTVVDLDGTVNCQKTETTVTLTGHFSVQERREFAADATFTLTVLGDPDDASAVAVALEALTLGDTSSVKRNLDLPAKGKRGTAITWQSSDESVVGADGKVYPAPNRDQTATLTATVTRGDATQTKDFPITVAGIVPVTLDSWSYTGVGGRGQRFTPVDGGALQAVALTCNDPNPGPDDRVCVTVYGPDGTEKASRDFSMTELFEGIPTGESVTMAISLKMDADDYFELSAKNTKTGAELIKPVRNDDTLAETATVYVVGDSTASVYGDDRYPRKGWAQMLEGYFDGVEVVDLALSGRASKSFKNEANYTTLKNSIKKGDYLLIQFGHNDDKADAYADPAGDRFTEGSFKASMLEYVELAWEKGAKPIIATSISRRKLSDEALEAYVAAARELAQELSIPCVDLYAATNGYVNEVGVDAAQDMFNCVKPYDSRFMTYPGFALSEFAAKGSSDDTHLNINGAGLIAFWAAQAIEAQGLPLAAKRNGRPAPELTPYAQAATLAPKTFTDLPADHWAKPCVDYLSARSLMEGAGAADTFAPETTLSRAMLATLLWRMEGQPKARIRIADFPDAAGDSWYLEAVRWCAEQEIVTGYENGNFGPEDPITREQLAVMFYRYAKYTGDPATTQEGTAILAFPDTGDVSPWAREAMTWAVETGLLQGTSQGTLDPQAPATRAQAAALLLRLMTHLAPQ